jgi:hypothetical protein
VIVEGDAKQIVDEVNVASPNLSIAGQFVDEIQAEIQGLRQALMVHEGRDSNKIAHALSKEASSLRLWIWHGWKIFQMLFCMMYLGTVCVPRSHYALQKKL